MTTSVLPSAAQRALSLFDQANIELGRANQRHKSILNRILSSKDESGQPLTVAKLEAVAGDRGAGFAALLAARDVVGAFFPAPAAPTVKIGATPAAPAVSQTVAAPGAPAAAPAVPTAAPAA